jgi:DNA-binding CsgD family transcriptional regulator
MDVYLFKQLQEQWRSLVQEPGNYIFDINDHERFSFLKYLENNEIAYAVLNNATFGMEYLSRNFFDVVGINEESFNRHNTAAFIDAVDKKHVKFFNLLADNFKDYWEKTPIDKRYGVIRTTFGLSMHHTVKGPIRLHIQTNVLELNHLNQPAYVFVIYRDITYMMKDDFYWFRFSNMDKTCETFAYHDGLKDLLKQDILTPREKEILKLKIEGKTVDEIAKQLFISKITVNNHRQNMLNKVGVKNTTALIHAAKLCQLLE